MRRAYSSSASSDGVEEEVEVVDVLDRDLLNGMLKMAEDGDDEESFRSLGVGGSCIVI